MPKLYVAHFRLSLCGFVCASGVYSLRKAEAASLGLPLLDVSYHGSIPPAATLSVPHASLTPAVRPSVRIPIQHRFADTCTAKQANLTTLHAVLELDHSPYMTFPNPYTLTLPSLKAIILQDSLTCIFASKSVIPLFRARLKTYYAQIENDGGAISSKLNKLLFNFFRHGQCHDIFSVQIKRRRTDPCSPTAFPLFFHTSTKRRIVPPREIIPRIILLLLLRIIGRLFVFLERHLDGHRIAGTVYIQFQRCTDLTGLHLHDKL